jgi:hypothetical protein
MEMPLLLQGALYHFLLSHCLPVFLADGEPSAKFHHDIALSLIERATMKYAGQKNTRSLSPSSHG